MFTDNKNFYPTPIPLIDKMLEKVNWETVNYMLEPNAGKGDIINYTKKCLANRKRKIELRDKNGDIRIKEYDDPKYINVDCIEIDSNLRAILKDEGQILVGDDFLQYNGFTRYDLIMMNPPFDNGDKHLLKAIQLMKNGGQIVCLLNAETIDNPYSNTRKDLLYRLDELRAEIEYIEDGFVDAERSTGVRTALIYINIEPTRMTMDIFSNLVSSYKEVQEDNIFINKKNELADNDIIKSIIKQYDIEAEAGLKVINDFRKMQNIIPNSKVESMGTNKIGHDLISLNVYYSKDHEEKLSFENKFLRQLRYKYWSTLFQLDQMSSLFTYDVKEKYTYKLEEFKQYDFNYSNIKQLQLDLSRNLDTNIKEAIIKLFDKLTYENSMGKNGNIHYYSGWKTNKAFAINKKLIIPFYNLYEYGRFSLSHIRDYFVEFEKCLTYLDCGKTSGEEISKLLYQLEYQSKYDGGIINCKYFDIQPKKKGTVHVWFNDLELLKKFNIFGSQYKGWLPDCYGKTDYENMNEEEKTVIDSFEGEAEYKKTFANIDSYLFNTSQNLLMITG